MLRIWLVSDQPWMRSGADSGNVYEAQASGGRIGNHRRKVRLSGQLSINNCPTGEFTNARALLDEFDFQAKEAARFDRRTKLGTVNGHEIDELATSCEPQTFYSEHSCGLRQGLYDQNAGHDRPSGEVAVEEIFVDRHRLDRDDRAVRDDFYDPVYKQHRVSVGQGRHHRTNVERSDGGLFRRFSHAGRYRPCGRGGVGAGVPAGACCCPPGCQFAGGVMLTLGMAVLSSAVTSAVMSIVG